MARNFEIDITYRCNLACKWCDRLYGTEFLKPDSITLNQMRDYAIDIAKYIEPLSVIQILGGEPTLHPQIFEILDILLEILCPSRAGGPLKLLTNGTGQNINSILDKIKKRYTQKQIVRGLETPKSRYTIQHHFPIFQALCDYSEVPENHYKGCSVKQRCGSIATPYGFYLCRAHMRIACLFKLGPGLDHVFTPEEEKQAANVICNYCIGATIGPDVSPTYAKILEEWRQAPYFIEPQGYLYDNKKL